MEGGRLGILFATASLDLYAWTPPEVVILSWNSGQQTGHVGTIFRPHVPVHDQNKLQGHVVLIVLDMATLLE